MTCHYALLRASCSAAHRKQEVIAQITRALQHYLGHRNIQHTVRYTELRPDRFKEFWL